MPDASQTIHELKFNPAEFIEGMDKVIAKQEQYKQKVDDTGREVAKLSSEIDRNVKNIASLQKGLDSLDKSSKNYGQDVKTLNTQIEQHTAKLEQLREKAVALQETYSKDKASLDTLTAAYGKATTAVQNLEKATSKPIGAALNPNQAITGVQKLSQSIETLRAKMLVRQDLLIRETDILKIGQYNREIDALREQILKLGNAGKKGYDDLGNAIKKVEEQTVLSSKEVATATTGMASAANIASRSFSFLRQAAYLIPGIGLAGIFNLVGEAAISLGEQIFNVKNEFSGSIPYIDRYNEAVKGAVEGIAGEVVKVETLVRALEGEKLSRKERIKAVEELKQQSPSYFGTLDAEHAKISEITEAYKRYALSIITTVEARIAEKDLTDLVAKRLALQKELNNVSVNGVQGLGDEVVKQYQETGVFALKIGETLSRTFGRAKVDLSNDGLVKNRITQFTQLLEGEDALVTKVASSITNVDKKLDKAKKEKKQPEDYYLQRLQELKTRLAALNESLFTSEDTIAAKVREEVQKRNAEYDKLYKEKHLTAPELASLKALNSTVGQAELAKEMKAFNEKRKAAQKQIDDELERLRTEDVDKRIANIKGEFEQETAALILERERQTIALEKSFNAEAERLSKDKELGLISEDQLNNALRDLMKAYDHLYTDLDAYIARKQAELSQKSFDRSVQGVKDLFTGTFTVKNEETTKKIDALTATYLRGETTYKKYQKDLTKILRDETAERLKLEKLDLEAQLSSVNNRLSNPETGDTAEFTKKLKKQQLDLRNQISQNQRQTDTNSATAQDADQQAELARLHDYVQAYVDIVSPILQIWQQANEAEAKSLEISIALQQKRVDAAQKVADRGNATYLKAEQDRMNDLQVKQADNARRQIAINAAIQASSALTAVVSGVAKAVITGNPLDAIAAVGAVIAAIGSGYALVKSLQQNQISFYEGTEDTGNGGKVDSKGGFHAILHPNERVLTKEQNKQLKGLSNEELVEVVNRSKVLVDQYRTPDLPELNYDKLEQAAHFHITSDGRLAALMEENNSKHDQTMSEIRRLNKTMKSIGVHFQMDKNGFMAIALEGINQANINKNV